MTDKKPSTNSGPKTTVSNPKPAGQAERVNPTTGGSAGTIDANNVNR
jgi:hypothetical protein